MPELPLVPQAEMTGAEEAKNSPLAMFLESIFVRDIVVSQRTVMFNVHWLTLRQSLEMGRNTSTIIAASCGRAQDTAILLTASQEEFPRSMYSKTLFSWGQAKWHFITSSNKENLFTSVQREHSNSSSGFGLFTLGMKWAPNTGTLVECYGNAVSREGHFSEDTEGRATPKCYQVTHVWSSNLIRAFEIPVVLWHRLCVHSKSLLCLGSFSFEIQEKRLQKLVNLAPWPCRWMKLPKKQWFEWFGDQRTLWLLQAVQRRQR